MPLYDEKATLSSPLVPILLKRQSPILHGYSEIYGFLEKSVQYRLTDLAKRDSPGFSLINNNTVIWEYPHKMGNNKQITTLETMAMKANKIFQHRIFWC